MVSFYAKHDITKLVSNQLLIVYTYYSTGHYFVVNIGHLDTVFLPSKVSLFYQNYKMFVRRSLHTVNSMG